MADNPLAKLARLVGGTALLPGSLGHQVLGQLLISEAKSYEVAGANIVLAAVSRQRNVAAKIAIRTIAPAAVVEALSRKESQRLERLTKELNHQWQALAVKTEEVRQQHEQLMAARQEIEHQQPEQEALLQEIQALKSRNEQLETELQKLRRQLGKKNALVQAVPENEPLDAKPGDPTAGTKPAPAPWPAVQPPTNAARVDPGSSFDYRYRSWASGKAKWAGT